MMPTMHGYKVLNKHRDNPESRDIAGIFITALDGAEEESQGLELGAADDVTNPLGSAIVLAWVKSQLESKQARECSRNQNVWLETEFARRMMQNERIQDVSMRPLASLAESRDKTSNFVYLALCQRPGYENS